MVSRDRLGTFVAVLLSTAIVAATLLLLTSARPRVPDRFAGLSVVVQSPAAKNSPGSFPSSVPWSAADVEQLTARLRTVPGVTGVTVDRPFYAQPVSGPATGNGWASAHTPLLEGRAPTGDKEVVVDRALGVPVGQNITLLTASGPAQWRVTGHVGTATVYVSDAVAARMSPGARAIGLHGNPDPGAVGAIVGVAGQVLTGDARGALEPRADARTRWIGMQVLSAMAGLAGFACVFLVASTSAFSVDQRRREIGLLRAVGATPRQVRSSLYRSALVVGAVAAAAGVGVGALAAVPLSRLLVSGGFEPPGYSVRWVPWALLVAFAAGPVVSLLGVAASARRASRTGPLDALRVAEVESRPMSRARWSAGLVFAVLGVVAGVYTASAADVTEMGQTSLLGAMALVVAVTLLAPAVIPLLVKVLLRPLTGVTAMLVRESALTGVRRTASTAAPVLLTVAFGIFVGGTVQTSTAAFAARRGAAVPAGVVLVPDGTPGLHDAAAPDAPLRTELYVEGAAVTAVGTSPVEPGSVLVSGSAASRYAGTVSVTYADGVREELRIAGTAPPGPLTADLFLSRGTVRAHDSSALATAAFVPGGTRAATGAKVVSAATYARQADTEEDRLVWLFTLLLLGVSAGAGALAVVNTLLMATRHRVRDYQVLRLAGAAPRQVALTVALESALVVVLGSVLGGAAALMALVGSARSLSAQIGETVPVVVPWSIVVLVVGACLVLAVAASALPAWKIRAVV